MQVHTVTIHCEAGSEHWRFICSDLHIGSPSFDAKRWQRDMDAAAKVNARVLVNGDVFDAIDFRDKRYDASALVPELRGEKDLQGAVVRLAAELMAPYRGIIDVIGVGNHEEKWINWNANDPVARLIERLNSQLEADGTDHRIRHGGICGFIRTRFFMDPSDPRGARVNHDLLYHHGSGGDSPVTKGSIDFYRRENQFLFDAVTMGHKHHRSFMDGCVVELTAKGRLNFRERKSIQTGSYYVNYRRTGQRFPLSYSYAESKAHSPKPHGGMFLRLRPALCQDGFGKSRQRYRTVHQDVMTEP